MYVENLFTATIQQYINSNNNNIIREDAEKQKQKLHIITENVKSKVK